MMDITFENTAIVACGTMSPELNYLREEGFLDTNHLFYTTPGLHQDIVELEKQLIKFITKAQEQVNDVIGSFTAVNFVMSMRIIRRG